MDSKNEPEKRLVLVNAVTSYEGGKPLVSVFINNILVAGPQPNFKNMTVAMWMVPEDKLLNAMRGDG